MMETQRIYSAEFKIDAANLVIQQGYSTKEACAATGVGETTIRRWVKQLRQESEGVTPNGQAMTP